ncbi:MAG: P83/100 family protein [Spirochaetaceae bacterium]|nr:P83/100 family protein [Spirochaetaceae bacterium]
MCRTVSLRSFLIAVALVLGASLSWGQDVSVDRDELASIGDQTIKFINYVGPHEFVNTLDQIRSIGRMLGESIDPGESGEASVGGKYRVLHIVSPDIEEGLDADIFILEPEAAVDHIANLRTIIAGYLETAYGFASRDAYLLAEFITYYNAVYRGDIAMANQRYKAPVTEELVADKMGLDTHYSNWAGRTQMLIPLRGDGVRGEGAPPVVDTGAISDEQVIEEMREEEDMGLDSRRDMVELREDEIDQDQAALDERKEDVERRDEAVTEELEELQDKEDSGEVLTPAEEVRREELTQEKAAVEEEKAEVEEQQQKIDERTEEVLDMRDDIAEDENARMQGSGTEDTFTSAPEETPVWFLLVDDEGDGIPYGRVVKYNLDDGRRLAVSSVTAVRGRSMAILPDSLLVIAGKEGGNSKVHLMLLDRQSLETTREGVDDVFPGSLMTVRGSDIYLVTTVGNEWRLGKFNTSLGRTAVSDLAVEPWTSISFDGDSLFVQGDNGEILKLSASTLKEEAVLE